VFVGSKTSKAKSKKQKAKASVVGLRCLHTYLHTADNCLLSGVNIEGFLSVFSHNPRIGPRDGL